MLASPTERFRRQRGVALITILLIVAILTAIVSRVSLSNQIWVRQVSNGNALAQADQATRAARYWVADILEQDKNNFDARTEVWARPLPPIPASWGILMGRVEDMQSRFNLNNLVNTEGKVDSVAMQQFERILRLLELEPGLAQAVIDWIDPDTSVSGVMGAEDTFYIGQEIPYFTANRPFEDTAELRLVRGIDSQAWQKLEPYVAALPVQTSINVNTASSVVLLSALTDWELSAGSMERVQRWVEQAEKKPAEDMNYFVGELLGGADKPVPPGLGSASSYFTAHTEPNFDNVNYRMSTLYQRDQGRVTVLRQNRELR